LRDTYGDDFAIKVFMTPDEIDLVFRDAEAVSTKTYQHGLGVGFEDDPLQRNLVGLSLERGWFRGYVLYLEGAPRAFWFGTVYNGTFHTGRTGFDPAYGDYHPGTFLLVRMIQDMCDDDAVDVIDYGFGDAEYKQTFGSENWLEHDVLIFASSPRAVRVNVVRTAVLGVDGLARRILGRRNLVSRLKRRWRNRLASDER
jgi:CelD/BcsL family acetyltransferase involved in cellulose biosynthesis